MKSVIYRHSIEAHCNRLLRCAAGSIALLVFCGTAGAQSPTLEEIIVTAEKREESLQDLGLSVSAFDADMLNDLGSRDIQELSSFVPNLQIGSETSDLKIMIRGVGSDNLEAFSDPGVAVHIDGVYQARPSGGNSLYYDMERVEVLRGPQGTLYGRNANGGAINFVSKQPTEEFGFGLDLSTGDQRWRRTRAMLNAPILGDTLMFRVAGTTEEQEGYQQNLVPGGTVGNDKDDTSLRAQLLWQPSDRASLLLATRSLDKGGVGPARKRTSSPGAGDTAPDGTPANCGDCGYVANPSDLRTVFKDTAEAFDLKSDSVSLTFNYDFDRVSLTAIAAHQSTDMVLLQDSDQSPIPTGVPGGRTDAVDVVQRSEQDTLEVRLASSGDSATDWLLGLYFLEENAFQNTVIDRDPTFGADLNINVLHDVDSDSFAIFGQVSHDISETLRITGGLRYTEDEKQAIGGTIVRVVPPFGPPNMNGSQGFTPSDSWTSTTWKAGFDWQATDNNMVYGSVSAGYKAGGFNFGVAGSESYDPEEVVSFEVGSKNRFLEDRVQLNATAFYYDYTDLQVFQVVDQTIVVRNAAEADIFGAELELIALAGENVRFDASLGLLEAEYENFVLPSNLFLGPPPDNAPTNIDVSGNTLINAPAWSGHIGAQYTFESDSMGSFTLRTQAYFSDDVYLRALNLSPYDIQDGYTTWDAKIMWNSPQEHWFAELFYNNISDEDVITNLEVTDSGIYFANLNLPRRWGAVFGVRF